MHLFRLFGINVYLHWSWLVMGVLLYHWQGGAQSPVLFALQYLTVFAIVLMHEFGHSLACRSVGGRADTIMLWPLGGVAYAQPPHRPGATLWTIFAGPLVNIILAPVLFLVALYYGDPDTRLGQYLSTTFKINLILLIFNMLPIYPLDGGQILQSLLWFVLGFVRSLRIASVIGLIGAVGLVLWAWQSGMGGAMVMFIGIYIGLEAWNGYRRAQAISVIAQRQAGFDVILDREMARQVPPPIPPAEPIYPPDQTRRPNW